MSEEVKIDVKYLRSQALKAADLSKFITEQAERMINEDEDMFVRYLAFARLKGIFKGVDMGLELSRDAIGMGHNLHHPFMQTPKAIENEWDKIKLEDDYFFTTDEQEKRDSFGKMIGAAIFGALKQSVKESKKDTPAPN